MIKIPEAKLVQIVECHVNSYNSCRFSHGKIKEICPFNKENSNICTNPLVEAILTGEVTITEKEES